MLVGFCVMNALSHAQRCIAQDHPDKTKPYRGQEELHERLLHSATQCLSKLETSGIDVDPCGIAVACAPPAALKIKSDRNKLAGKGSASPPK